MALPGFYLINYTDPRKQSFVIEPYQTDGGISPTSPIPHGSARRISTSLLLYGRDVPNYGERIAENFVQLLENFAGPAAPYSPIEGQMWFDTGSSYEIAAWTNFSTLALTGNVQAEFAKYIADQTVLTLAFRPVNASVDNSYQQVQVLPKTVSVAAGNTIVTFATPEDQPIELPATVVGGFLASSLTYSRMRVATKVGNEIKWVDVTNVYSNEDEPETRHRQVGDLWFDTATQQLMVFGTSGWASVAAKYLPLSGGTLTGDLQMGSNRVFSSAVTDNTPAHQYALVNRTYVDGINNNLQTQIDVLADAVAEIENVDLAAKVSRAGDEMTGTLVFGPGGTTPTVALGIDMANNPITRVSITWNAADYLSASFQPTYAVTKAYVAQAFRQHLLDEEHGSGGFIQAQPDGTGLVPNSIFFNAGSASSTYTISWKDLSGNNEHKIYSTFAGVSSSLVIEAGTDANDYVDVRHSIHSPAANPLFRFASTLTRSFNSLYIHDGQPQPQDNSVPTALVDDNRAATKGFVRQYVADNMPDDNGGGGSGSGITNVTYAYNVPAKTYTLSVFRDTEAPIIVNEYHQHDPYDIPYNFYMPSEDWTDFEVDVVSDYVRDNSPAYPETNVGVVLEALTSLKAPVEDAVFTNLPRVGLDVEILEYNTAARTVRVLADLTGEMLPGMKFVVDSSNGNDGLYTSTAIVAGAASNGTPTTVITVAEPLTFNGVEPGDAFIMMGAYAAADEPRSLVTRTTLDFELQQVNGVRYGYWKATAAGTNVVRSVGFTYVPGRNKLWLFKNGIKQRVNIMSGGDFNETSATTITIGSVAVDDEFEFYEI